MVRVISLGRCIYLLLIERAEYSQEVGSHGGYEKLCLFCRGDKLWVVQWFLKTVCKAAAGNGEVNVDWFVERCWPPGCMQPVTVQSGALSCCTPDLLLLRHSFCSTGFWFLCIQISPQSIFFFFKADSQTLLGSIESNLWKEGCELCCLISLSGYSPPPSYF